MALLVYLGAPDGTNFSTLTPYPASGIVAKSPQRRRREDLQRIARPEALGACGKRAGKALQNCLKLGVTPNYIAKVGLSETLHEDIRLAVGLQEPSALRTYTRKQRNPYFRQAVLDAYQYQCAICGYNLRYRNTLIGVEAAHIQWHNSQGPDEVDNGLALCSIHHKLLDYGAIGFDHNRELLIASGVNGADLNFWLHRHKGRGLQLPSNGVSEPRPEYLQWQRREVFKG